MKFKYFLRGLGFGIVFASVIFLTAYRNQSVQEISDEVIIERAKELGMVEQEDKVGDLLEDKNSTETVSSESDSLSSDNSETNISEQDTGETEEIETSTEDNGTEENTTEDTITEDVSNSEDVTTENDTINTVTITVERGSTSYPVCQKLQEAGMIEDAGEFDTYLVENGYANRIRVGEHVLTPGMDYHAIAEAISDPA
jgi:hypothetical protein